MNATGSIAMDPPKMSGFAYGFGVSAGILLLITTVTLASYFCARNNNPPPPPPPPPPGRWNRSPASVETTDDLEVGIDEATLATYPKLLYSRKAKAQEEYKGTNASCCSICLADYKDGDVLRLLPDCNHLFHLKCVDPWLRQHPTCPVCRASPLPSPLAEVVPLSRLP
ncbi:unnamed protein product [Spirodela intermedia]|uniref:RING-type domain-containing protein n=1 Tax=Spirodela intermedia TaxID=51605 RepID=A0A7I8KAA8_SPIIN|nr:unnamed protein product [Spirodela intermedia]